MEFSRISAVDKVYAPREYLYKKRNKAFLSVIKQRSENYQSRSGRYETWKASQNGLHY